jgi:serine/threonine protein kinase
MASVNHPACLALLAFDFRADGEARLVTDVMSVDLQRVITDAQRGCSPPWWDDTGKSIVILGIAAGMRYLHAKNIIHRDLKPANILIEANTHNNTHYPRIADFGLSKVMDISRTSHMTQGIGTPAFMAPEIHKGQNYDFKVDVYAFGMLMYFILSEEEVPAAVVAPSHIINGSRPPRKRYLPREISDLIEKCWDQEPTERPSFEDIVEDAEMLKLPLCDHEKFDEYRYGVLNLGKA